MLGIANCHLTLFHSLFCHCNNLYHLETAKTGCLSKMFTYLCQFLFKIKCHCVIAVLCLQKNSYKAQILCSLHLMMISYLPFSSSSLAAFKQKSKDNSWCMNSATARQNTMTLRLSNQLTYLTAYYMVLQLLWKKKIYIVLKPRKNKTSPLYFDFPFSVSQLM